MDNTQTPRRMDTLRMVAAEIAILGAIREVEMSGADIRLTRAVALLQEAREAVADFVDGIPAKPDGATTDIEIAALGTISRAARSLVETAARRRVLRWAVARYLGDAL